MEELLYWIIEYVKVLLGYGFIMFVWPSAVFRKYLRGKSLTFRFGFCATVPIVLINTVVLLLGLVHILNKWTMWIFFYGLFIWSFREKFRITEEVRKKFKYLITGTFGWKHLLLLTRDRFVRFVKRTFWTFWKFYRVHWLEYTLLVVAVVYGILYFSWGVFHEHSYVFSDVYTHHSWIYQLTQGKPFSAGIYPEGMHCVVYGLYALFNIRIYTILLFLPSVNMAVILVAIYCFIRELFQWRYSAILALYIFLTVELTNRIFMISMARAQCALPQEYAFPAIFLCALFLLRYLKSKKTDLNNERFNKWCINDNLLIFIMALAVTIAVHFYATIMAFYLCVAIAIVCWRKIFRKTHFLPLVVAAISGLLIAATPMVAGVATGIPLQGSMYWALGLITNSSSADEEAEVIIPEDVTEMEGVSGEQREENIDISNDNEQISKPVGENNSTQAIVPEVKKKSLLEKIADKAKSVLNVLKAKGDIMYTDGYSVMYGEERAGLLIRLSVGCVLLWGVYKCVATILSKRSTEINQDAADGYLIIVLGAVIYVVSYVATGLGLPMLMEGYRSGFINHLLMMMIIVVYFDMLFVLMKIVCRGVVLHILSVVVVAGVVSFIICTDNYHGYLYFEVTRFDATVDVTNSIIKTLPQHSYTIVSPTEELYQVIEYGRHEELLTLCEKQYRSEYIIPTEYVFIFVEKKPLKYAQYHFYDGPKWLATNKYQKTYGTYSVSPNYITGELDEQAADKGIIYFSKKSDSYLDLKSRTILQSKAYNWCQRFNELYPNELRIYYEDEYFVCYYFKQNESRLYNLVIE